MSWNDYDDVYYDEEDGRMWEDLDENEDPDDVVESLRGTIERGDCIYCGGKLTMTHEGNVCFICSKCGKAVDEDIYYRWIAGYPVEFED